MAQFVAQGGLLITLEDIARTPAKQAARRRLPLDVSDFIRQALMKAPSEHRGSLKWLFASMLGCSTRQLDAIQAWSNGKLRGRRRRGQHRARS